MYQCKTKPATARLAMLLLCGCLAGLMGCSTRKAQTSQAYFTSGSNEADQRAAQEMAKAQQYSGTGQGGGESGVEAAKPATPNAQTSSGGETNKPAQATGKLTLFAELGGEAGISNIVMDFLPRVMQDPRVNWDRKGVVQGGLSFHRNRPETWNPTPEHVALLQKHMIQFLVLATGGPPHYTGLEMRAAHANLHITNPEFDAAMGDLKESLDKFKIPNTQQKELLAVVETTRPQIVTER